MQEENSKCGHCYNCGYYTPYYTKGNIKFTKIKRGHCRAKQTVVDGSHFCEEWSGESYRYKTFSKPCVEKALFEILSQLSEIRQIIEEELKGNESN